MDEIEQRLTQVLTRASTAADPAAARLRNPAAVRELAPQRAPRRPRTAWVVAASGLAAAAVVTSVTLAGPLLDKIGGHREPPPAWTGATSSPRPGARATWALTVQAGAVAGFDGLPRTDAIAVPTPHTVDPRLAGEAGGVPELVTSSGTVRFPKAHAVHLLAERSTGVLVAVEGAGRGEGDGLRDVQLTLVAPGASPRVLFEAARADRFAVSPDGATVAAVLPAGGEKAGSETSVVLIDVAAGRVLHRMTGGFEGIAWASDSVLVLDAGRPLVWRAPFDGSGERLSVSATSVLAVDGGVVLADEQGCLRRVDADGKLAGENCGGWSVAGQASPDGRYLPLEWRAKDGTTTGGVLDVHENSVRAWPVAGVNPSWVAPDAVLVTERDAEDRPRRALCGLPSWVCLLAPDDLWSSGADAGAQWLGQ